MRDRPAVHRLDDLLPDLGEELLAVAEDRPVAGKLLFGHDGRDPRHGALRLEAGDVAPGVKAARDPVGGGDRGVHVHFADVPAVEPVELHARAAHGMRENAAQGSLHGVISEKADGVEPSRGEAEAGSLGVDHVDPGIEVASVDVFPAAVVVPEPDRLRTGVKQGAGGRVEFLRGFAPRGLPFRGPAPQSVIGLADHEVHPFQIAQKEHSFLHNASSSVFLPGTAAPVCRDPRGTRSVFRNRDPLYHHIPIRPGCKDPGERSARQTPALCDRDGM